MTITERINQDIKQAMLSGDKALANILRGLKSAILSVEIEQNKRDQGLSDAEVVAVLSKEQKKRQESADLYTKGGSQERAEAELAEKAVIEKYLPAQLSEAELIRIVDEAISASGASDIKAMGQVIGEVRQKTAGQADGAMIARLVKERLSS